MADFEDLKDKIKGVVVVMIAPFKENYELDEDGLRKLTRFLIDSGTKEGRGVLVPAGSTGECPMLTDEERKKIFEIVKEEAKDTVPVIGGCNHTDTKTVINNVYFGSYEDTKMIPSRTYDETGVKIETRESFNPELLWKKLEKSRCPFITVPHHPPVICHAFNWGTFNPRYDRLVEVFSGWGDHWFAEGFLRGNGSDKEPDLSVKKAFENGLLFGMIASSDAHDGCPGSSQGSGLYGWANKFSRVGSGLAAVKVNTLNLEDIFDSLYNRQCYATTGIHALIDFTVDDAGIGKEILTKSEKVAIKLSVRSPIEVTKVKIYKGNKLISRIFSDEKEEEIELEDRLTYGEIAQYVAIVDFKGHERAWSSPIRITRE